MTIETPTTVRLCTYDDLDQVYEMIYNHTSVAGVKIDKQALAEFKLRFSKDIITFGFFKNNKLKSFLITRQLSEIPSWYITLWSTDQVTIKNLKNCGIPQLFDAAVDYWEKQNIFSFFFIQTVKHRNILNGRITSNSERLKEYEIPGATIEIIKKGELSKFTLINKLCKNNVSEKDRIVKWVFKKNHLQDEFK